MTAPTQALSFHPLRENDLSLMQRWHGMPHVDAWWHEPYDLNGIKAKYEPCIVGREPTHVFLIHYGECPIGWIQWFRWADYPTHAASLGAGGDCAGVDIAIGEATMLGRGLGSQALSAFVEGIIVADLGITACVSDPETRNTRSIRAFEKAGFEAVRIVQLPGEPVTRQVMQRQRRA